MIYDYKITWEKTPVARLNISVELLPCGTAEDE
jgi:hypothetical protein